VKHCPIAELDSITRRTQVKISLNRPHLPAAGAKSGADPIGSGHASRHEATRSKDGGESSKLAAPRQQLNSLKQFFGGSGPGQGVRHDPARHQGQGVQHDPARPQSGGAGAPLASQGTAAKNAEAGEAIAAQAQQAREAKMSANGIALDPARHGASSAPIHEIKGAVPEDPAEFLQLLKEATDGFREKHSNAGEAVAAQGQQAREAKMSANGIALDPARHGASSAPIHEIKGAVPEDPAEFLQLLKEATDAFGEEHSNAGKAVAAQGQQAREAKMSANGIGLDSARHEDQILRPRDRAKPAEPEHQSLMEMASDDRQDDLRLAGYDMAAAARASKGGDAQRTQPLSARAEKAVGADVLPAASPKSDAVAPKAPLASASPKVEVLGTTPDRPQTAPDVVAASAPKLQKATPAA
jgi:hypothetical protein